MKWWWWCCCSYVCGIRGGNTVSSPESHQSIDLEKKPDNTLVMHARRDLFFGASSCIPNANADLMGSATGTSTHQSSTNGPPSLSRATR